MHESANMQMTWTGSSYDYISVSHQNGFWAEYSGRNLAEYSAETVSVKIMSFGDERNIR